MWEKVLFFPWCIPFMWKCKIKLVLESLQDECSLVSNSYLQYLHDIKIPLKYTSLKRAIAECCLWAQPLYLVFCKYGLWFSLRCCHNRIWLSLSLEMMLARAVPLQLTWTSPQGAVLTATPKCAQLAAVAHLGSRGTALLLAKPSLP